jgi:hypothetical protein
MITHIDVSSSLSFCDSKGLTVEDMEKRDPNEDIAQSQSLKDNGRYQEISAVNMDLALKMFEEKYMGNLEGNTQDEQNVGGLLGQQERESLKNLKKESFERNMKEVSMYHERMSSDKLAIREQNEGDTLQKQDKGDAIGQKEVISKQPKS